MYQRIYHQLESTGRVKSAVVLTGAYQGRRCVCQNGRCTGPRENDDTDWSIFEQVIEKTEETGVVSVNGEELMIEVFLKNPRLVILGGGHVSCPTARIGKMLGFHVTVMDDREEFLTRERFPDADLLVKGSFAELSDKIPPYENTYYVVVTRGHAGDSACARQILKRPYAYFGMIGSKNKVRICRETLLQEGFEEQRLDTMHAPIGLPIGGQLPEEIAVSIMAEIVQEKNRHYTAFTDEKIAGAVLGGATGVMMTITKKSGSSPRGVGSKMFLDKHGTLYGSIGGGKVEFEAMQHAASVPVSDVRSYNLSNSGAERIGMICGGKVEVLFERI